MSVRIDAEKLFYVVRKDNGADIQDKIDKAAGAS